MAEKLQNGYNKLQIRKCYYLQTQIKTDCFDNARSYGIFRRSLEKDLNKLENICTSFITEDDLDDFCENLYENIQGVGERIQEGVKNEINS